MLKLCSFHGHASRWPRHRCNFPNSAFFASWRLGVRLFLPISPNIMAMLKRWPCHPPQDLAGSWGKWRTRRPPHRRIRFLSERGSWGFQNLESGNGHPCKVLAKYIRGAGTAAKGRVDLYLHTFVPWRFSAKCLSLAPQLCVLRVLCASSQSIAAMVIPHTLRHSGKPFDYAQDLTCVSSRRGTQDATIELILFYCDSTGSPCKGTTLTCPSAVLVFSLGVASSDAGSCSSAGSCTGAGGKPA